MIFVLQYDRRQGQLVSKQVFRDRAAAAHARLTLEVDLNRLGIDHEVVTLEAESEDALRLTHRRYFQSVSELLQNARESVA